MKLGLKTYQTENLRGATTTSQNRPVGWQEMLKGQGFCWLFSSNAAVTQYSIGTMATCLYSPACFSINEAVNGSRSILQYS